MILAGSPGRAQMKAVITAGTNIGKAHAASTRMKGLIHHLFKASPDYFLAYFQSSMTVK